MVAILEKLLEKKANKRIVTMPSNGDVPFTHVNVSHAAQCQSNCSLAQCHLFCSCSPSRDLKAMYVKIPCWNGRMQKQNHTTQLQYF
jgi:hypothetical protein